MNQIRTVALLGLLSGLLVAISSMMFGSSGAIIGLGLAAVMNFGSWFFSDKIALAAYGAQPLEPNQAPQIYGMVERLCQRAGLPMPKVFVIPSDSPNAFATGRDPKHAAVAVTQGIVRLLSVEELEGVLAHELSHIANRDTLTQAVAATVAGAIAYLAQIAQFSLLFGGRNSRDGGNILGALVTIFVAPLAATIVQMGISRTREFAADAGAARLTGNPRALASALQRLQSGVAAQRPINANPAFSPLLIMNPLPPNLMRSLFSTHPSTEQRIERLMALEQGPSRFSRR